DIEDDFRKMAGPAYEMAQRAAPFIGQQAAGGDVTCTSILAAKFNDGTSIVETLPSRNCHRGTMAIVLLDRKRSSIRACAERSLGFSAGSWIGSICFATRLTTGFGCPPASERNYRPLKLQ